VALPDAARSDLVIKIAASTILPIIDARFMIGTP